MMNQSIMHQNAKGERLKAWQCIGCGKVESPQPCIGVCQDRRIELVDAVEYDEVLAELEVVRERTKRLEAVVRQLATITPRSGGWERSYRSLQERARRALDMTNLGHGRHGIADSRHRP